MSDGNDSRRSESTPAPRCVVEDVHWVEIFADRVADDLKLVLQEDMDWATSRPILERLNRLREVEGKKSGCADDRTQFPMAS